MNTILMVTIECESCDNKYGLNIPLAQIAEERYSYTDRFSRKEVRGSTPIYSVKPEDAVYQIILKCPNCGYYQSWMKERALQQSRRRFGVKVGLLSMTVLFLTFVIASKLTESATYLSNYILIGLMILSLLGMIASLLSLIGLWDFLITPNRKHAPVEAEKKPHFTMLSY